MAITRKHIKSDQLDYWIPIISAMSGGAYLKANQGTSNGWYALFSNGFCIQAGSFDVTLNGGLANGTYLTLPKAFANNSYFVVLQLTSGQGQANDICVGDRTTSKFKVYNVNQVQNKNQLVGMWLAAGNCTV